MSEIELIEPHIEYADDIWAFRDEILKNDEGNEDIFAGCMSLDDCASAEEWIRICELRKDEKTCEQTGVNVPSTTYLAVRKSDNRIVGIIDLRHHINHPILGTWGGHSGYSVRPSERGRGYATDMLKLNLEKARERGIDKFLVTCSEENKASEHVILKNGGIFEKNMDVDGIIIKRYWIIDFFYRNRN